MRRGLRRGMLFFLLLLLYVLFFPLQTGREFTLQAIWAFRPGDGAARTSQLTTEDDLVPYALGDRFGYVDSQGRAVYSAVSAGRVALTPDRFVSYLDRSERLVVQAPDGSLLHVIDAAGYPLLFTEGALIIAPDGVTLSRYDTEGHLQWSRVLESTVSAVDTSPTITVAGLVGGGLTAVRPSGAVLPVDAAAVGLAGVTGAVTVRKDGGAFAAVTGSERIISGEQALLSIVTLYNVEQARAAPILRREFTREASRTPQLFLSSSGRYLLYSVGVDPGGAVRVIDLERGNETAIALLYPAEQFALREDESTVWLLSRAGRPDPALGFRTPATVELHTVTGRRLLSTRFAADAVTMRYLDELLVLTIDDRVLALKLELQ